MSRAGERTFDMLRPKSFDELRAAPWLPVVAILFLSALLSALLWRAERRATAERVDRWAAQIEYRLSEHVSAVYGMAAVASMNDRIDRTRLVKYLDDTKFTQRAPGAEGVGFLMYAKSDRAQEVRDEINRNYGEIVPIWPSSTTGDIFAVVLFEPQTDRTRVALGFNAASEPVRRATIARAIASKRAATTPPLTLVLDAANPNDTARGFWIGAPVYSSDVKNERLLGIFYTAFRADNLLQPVIAEFGNDRLVSVHMNEVSDASLIWNDGQNRRGRLVHTFPVADQTWIVSFDGPPAIGRHGVESWVLALLGGGLLSLITGALVSAQRSVVDTSKALMLEQAARLEDKDVLLREMNHRIKNIIARVLSLTRLTARSVKSKDELVESLTRRLEAMGRAQDALTASDWQAAELKRLICDEIDLVADPNASHISLDGPRIMLDAQQSQALGLVFHELATNASKYGALQAAQGKLEIDWHVETGETGAAELRISWKETGLEKTPDLSREGFGTELTRIMITGMLKGVFKREAQLNAFLVTITLPHREALNVRAPAAA